VSTKEKVTPEQELRNLCDFSVKDCVAHVSEFTPGAEFFDKQDSETLIESLKRTPDLTGVLLDGLASLRRPGTLDDTLVFYNLSEEEMFEHLANVKREEHVHWMFNKILDIQNEWLEKFRKALPGKKIVYSIDSDDFHANCERMLRVIVQSIGVKAKASQKSLEASLNALAQVLNGFGKPKKSTLDSKLQRLQLERKKYTASRRKKRIQKVDEEIAEIKSYLNLEAKRLELTAKLKVFKDANDEKRTEETEAELVAVKSSIATKEKGLQNALTILEAERELLKGVRGRQPERDALDKEIKKLTEEISITRGKMMDISLKLDTITENLSYFRDPETSPMYQKRVSDHVSKMYERFQELGEKHDIQIVTKPEVLVFGSLVIDYAHDRGRTWHPMPGRVKRLAESYHGLMNNYRENIKTILEEMESKTTDIDVIMESGHAGVFFARWQRLHLTDEEIRMQHVNTFYTGGSDGVKVVTFITGMPFEAQDKIAKYLNRSKPARTRAGKPIATASHPVFIRNKQRSVSGVTLVRKHNHGLISVEPILYKLYRNKAVLEPFVGVASQDDSDNHFGSPEMDSLGTLGTLAMNDELMEQPLELYGKKIYIGGKFNLGDTAEANNRAWKEGHKFRREAMGAMKDIIKNLVGMDQADYESVMKMAILHANDMMGGSQENLKLNQRTVAWFHKKQFLNVYHKSPSRLRDMHIVMQGNHFANANRDSGIGENDAYEEWLLALANLHKDFPNDGHKRFISLKLMAGGDPQYFRSAVEDHEIVVHSYGYSVARQGAVAKYGISHDKKLLVQKTYRIGLSHEPSSALNKARNQNADVLKTGHTHEATLNIDKSGDNDGRFLDQICTTQRVTSTELVYGGLPRTAGVELKVYSQPGRYFKLVIPMEHMRHIGLAWLKIMARQAIEEAKALKDKTKKATNKKTTATKPKKKKKKNKK